MADGIREVFQPACGEACAQLHAPQRLSGQKYGCKRGGPQTYRSECEDV